MKKLLKSGRRMAASIVLGLHITEKLKLAQQTTEEIFLSGSDNDADTPDDPAALT